MTPPAPTTHEIRAICEAEIASHEPCDGCDIVVLARWCLDRLDEQPAEADKWPNGIGGEIGAILAALLDRAYNIPQAANLIVALKSRQPAQSPDAVVSEIERTYERSLLNCCEVTLQDYGNYTEHPAHRVAQALHEILTSDVADVVEVEKRQAHRLKWLAGDNDAITEPQASAVDDVSTLLPIVKARQARGLPVVDEIAAERERQQKAEGWNVAHDDEHDNGSMAQAAAAYALNASNRRVDAVSVGAGAFRRDLVAPIFGRTLWPWDLAWWKPKDPRRDLIRAAALIVAEIERLDRLTTPAADGGGVNG